MDACASEQCVNPSRWPRPRGRIGFCDECLAGFAQRQHADMLRLGEDARARFRVRHTPCGAVTDVSLPMLRKGWVCRACKLGMLSSRGWAQGRGTWSLDRQELLLHAAGFRPLNALVDNCAADHPVNVECVECGTAQTDSLFGISEGLRLSWLPCTTCNARRFKPTEQTVRARLELLGLELTGSWSGDPGAHLEARCRRCGTSRAVSWSTLGSAPPCLRCDGRRLDPDAPHRVYLFEFPHLGPSGIYKVGITHCVDDRRLTQHRSVGGRLIQVIEVANRATALALEARVLTKFRSAAPTSVATADLPYGGATECWDAFAGFPDLALWAQI